MEIRLISVSLWAEADSSVDSFHSLDHRSVSAGCLSEEQLIQLNPHFSYFSAEHSPVPASQM